MKRKLTLREKWFWVKHFLYVLRVEGLNQNNHDLKWRWALITNYFWVMVRALVK